jgi:hypothetical protein
MAGRRLPAGIARSRISYIFIPGDMPFISSLRVAGSCAPTPSTSRETCTLPAFSNSKVIGSLSPFSVRRARLGRLRPLYRQRGRYRMPSSQRLDLDRDSGSKVGESMRRYDWLFAISLAWIAFLAIAFLVIAIPLVFCELVRHDPCTAAPHCLWPLCSGSRSWLLCRGPPE